MPLIPGRISLWRRKLDGRNARRSAVALVDQAVVGATSLFTSLLVGRSEGPAELGLFAIGISMNLLAVSAQEALVTSPLTIFASRFKGGRRARYLGSTLAQYGVSAATFAVVWLLVGAVLACWRIGPPGTAEVILVLAFVTPAWLLREYARRVAFAELNTYVALIIGAVAATIQMGLLGGLAVAGEVSAVAALGAVGAASGLTAVCWLAVRRTGMQFARRQILATIDRHWRIGKWILAGQMADTIYNSSIPWILVFMRGKSEAGIYAACCMMVAFANPLVVSLNNVLTPRIANAYADGGRTEVRRVTWKVTRVVAVVVGAFCLFIMVSGGFLLTQFYGEPFRGNHLAIAILACAVLVHTLGMPVARALLVLEQSRLLFRVQLIGTAATYAGTLALLPSLGLRGVAVSQLGGYVIQLGLLVGYYRTRISRS